MKKLTRMLLSTVFAVGAGALIGTQPAHALPQVPDSCNHFSVDYDPLQCFFDGGGIDTSGGGGDPGSGGTPTPADVDCYRCSLNACTPVARGYQLCTDSQNTTGSGQTAQCRTHVSCVTQF